MALIIYNPIAICQTLITSDYIMVSVGILMGENLSLKQWFSGF